jgi:hypothetical protein
MMQVGEETPAHGATWNLAHSTVQGDHHILAGKVNQDAATTRTLNDGSVLIAVADGHGGERYVRSDRGSRFAVEVFMSLAGELVTHGRRQPLPALKNLAEMTLPRHLDVRWRERVRADLIMDPLSPPTVGTFSLLTKVGSGDQGPPTSEPGTVDAGVPAPGAPPGAVVSPAGDDLTCFLRGDAQSPGNVPLDGPAPLSEEIAAGALSEDQLLAYGTTLVGVALTDEVLLAWQIGDGNLVVVGADGSVSMPLQPETPQLGVEVESLCQPRAWTLIRTCWLPLSSMLPSLVLVSTDGLANGYVNDEGFCGFAAAVVERLAESGIESVREQMPGWLKTATSFSGDDVSMAIAWCPQNR